MRTARAALIGVGAAGTAWGAWALVSTVAPVGLLRVVLWLVAAVVLHDAILAPVLFAASWVLRLLGRGVPMAALAVVQGAAVLGGVGSLVLLPATGAKAQGTRNATVLPLDYAANLAGMWVALAVLSAAGIAAVVLVGARRPRGARPTGS